MTSLLRRHLSYANLMATIAVFLALCGGAYAAAKINGNSIKKHTIGAGKLKNGTLTSAQIKPNSLNASVIDISSLGTVPSAQTAVSATSAQTASSAARATVAESADRAGVANSATSATNADHAATAGDAETLDGSTAEDLTVSCPAATENYGGMCWDTSTRPTKNWIVASIACGDAGGRLPTLSELIAFVARPGTQVSGQTWTGDLVDISGGNEFVATSDETTRSTGTSGLLFGYRCLFPQVN